MHARVVAGSLIVWSCLFATSPASGALEDLFRDIAIGEIVTASPAELDRQEVDPANIDVSDPLNPKSIPVPGGRTIDPGFFTGQLRANSALTQFTGDTMNQVRNLPLSSSVPAFTFSFDPATNVFRNDQVGLGPILADRAQTIGKGKFNVGVSYAKVDFKTFEGESLSSFELDADIDRGRVYTTSPQGLGDFNGAVLTVLLEESGGTIPTNERFPISFPPEEVISFERVVQPPGTSCGLVEVAFNPNLGDFGCFFDIDGLASGIFVLPLDDQGQPRNPPTVAANAQAIVPDGDAFLEIMSPGLDVDMDINVDVVNIALTAGVLDSVDVGVILPIVSIDVDATATIEAFDNGCDPLDDSCNRMFVQDVANGVREFEDTRTVTSFDVSDSATGIGDLALRAKYHFFHGKWIDAAVRGTIFFPTGRDEDFLGTGEWAGEAAMIASKTYWNRLAVHANVGVYLSGDSDASQIRYRAGLSGIIFPRLNIGFDVLGSHDLNHDDIGDDIVSIGPGIKWNPWGRLVLTGAAIFKLNDDGLRADVIPAFNVEYTLE